MRCCVGTGLGNFCTGRNQYRLRHALVERSDVVALQTLPRRVRVAGASLLRSMAAMSGVKNTDDGRVATRKDAQDATGATAVRFWRVERDEHLIALHRAVHCIGRDEDVTIGCGA